MLNIDEQGLTMECGLPEITPAEQGQFSIIFHNTFWCDFEAAVGAEASSRNLKNMNKYYSKVGYNYVN